MTARHRRSRPGRPITKTLADACTELGSTDLLDRQWVEELNGRLGVSPATIGFKVHQEKVWWRCNCGRLRGSRSSMGSSPAGA
ncbi:MAG: hypothetical protein ACOZNI_21135 [Myxococcota bacterium]